MSLLEQLKHSAGKLRAKFRARRYRKPQGRRGIRKLGHREYVGGLWDEMGQLQFDFLVEQGLTPSDVLPDVGCGSLRGGVHFIRYLEPGNYLGMEKEEELLELRVNSELGIETFQARRPELVASGSFEFERFSKTPTFAFGAIPVYAPHERPHRDLHKEPANICPTGLPLLCDVSRDRRSRRGEPSPLARP